MAKRSRARIMKTMPRWMHWDWVNDTVEVISAGHYPDTVMVRYQDKDFEACMKDLVETKHAT